MLPAAIATEKMCHVPFDETGEYAATPPLEALRTILSLTATKVQGRKSPFKVMTNDVSRACFYAPSQPGQFTYVKIPPADTLLGEEEMRGLLNYSMYGTRRAATNWQQHFTSVLLKAGYGNS